jgi:hypothetical protein
MTWQWWICSSSAAHWNWAWTSDSFWKRKPLHVYLVLSGLCCVNQKLELASVKWIRAETSLYISSIRYCCAVAKSSIRSVCELDHKKSTASAKNVMYVWTGYLKLSGMVWVAYRFDFTCAAAFGEGGDGCLLALASWHSFRALTSACPHLQHHHLIRPWCQINVWLIVNYTFPLERLHWWGL